MTRHPTAWTLLIVIALLVTVPLALLLVAPMSYSGLIERIVRTTTGLEASLDDLQVDLFPPRIETSGFVAHAPDNTPDEAALAIDHLALSANAGRLLRQAPDWWRAEASGVRVRPAHFDSGRGQDRGQRPAGPTSMPGFESIRISDLDIFPPHDQAKSFHVTELSLLTQADRRLRVNLDASYHDQPLTASGTLVLPGGQQSREVDFQASVFGSELHVSGTLGHDGIAPGEARINLEARDLSTLGQLLNRNFSALAPATLNGTVQAPRPDHWVVDVEGNAGEHALAFDVSSAHAGQRWTFDNLALRIGASELSGSTRLDLAGPSFKADLSSPLLDINQLLRLVPGPAAASTTTAAAEVSAVDAPRLALPEQVSLDADVQIAELRYQNYRIDSLTLKAKNAAGVMQFDGTVDGLAATAENTSAWQLVEPLQMNGTLNLAPQANAAATFSAQFSGSGFSGGLSASLPRDRDRPTRTRLQASVENLSAVRGIDTARWKTMLPVSLSARASATPSSLQLELDKAVVSGSEVQGNFRMDRASTPPRIRGDLHSAALDINRFPTTSTQALEDSGQEIDKDSGDLIGEQPIDWSWLEAAVLDLDVRLDELTFNQTRFRNLRTTLALADGQLRIDPLDADLSKGGVRGDMRIRKSAAGATVDTRLVVTELMPADLGQRNEGLIDGGETDLMFELQATGASPQQLAGTLNGEIALEIQRATVRNNLFEMIGSDILTQTVSLINPFAKQDDRTDLECAAVRFEAADGVLSSPDQIVIETSKMKIRAGGEIDLGKETLRIDFVPSARTGLGISAGDLAKFVRLGGTLGNPQPVADPKGILKSGATIGAAIATGGASLLAQGLFKRARNAGTACGTIFENNTEVPDAIRTSDPATETDS